MLALMILNNASIKGGVPVDVFVQSPLGLAR